MNYVLLSCSFLPPPPSPSPSCTEDHSNSSKYVHSVQQKGHVRAAGCQTFWRGNHFLPQVRETWLLNNKREKSWLLNIQLSYWSATSALAVVINGISLANLSFENYFDQQTQRKNIFSPSGLMSLFVKLTVRMMELPVNWTTLSSQLEVN